MALSTERRGNDARPLSTPDAASNSDTLGLVASLHRHWPVCLMEAGQMSLYMFRACSFATLLQHPGSSVRHILVGNIVRRALMGLAIGATVMTLILSPWGKRSGGHVNPAMTRAFCRLGKLHHWGRAVLRSRTVLRRNDRRRARDIVAERRPRGWRGSLCSDHSRRVWCRWRVCSRISHFSCPDDHGIGRDEP